MTPTCHNYIYEQNKKEASLEKTSDYFKSSNLLLNLHHDIT